MFVVCVLFPKLFFFFYVFFVVVCFSQNDLTINIIISHMKYVCLLFSVVSC